MRRHSIRDQISKLRAVVDSGNSFLNDTIAEAADTMEKLDTVAKAARAFADSMTCLDKECVHKKCVLNRALAELDTGE